MAFPLRYGRILDRVDTRWSSIIQLEQVVDLTLFFDDLDDAPRPAAQGHVGEEHVAYARLNSNLVSHVESRVDRSDFCLSHASILGAMEVRGPA